MIKFHHLYLKHPTPVLTSFCRRAYWPRHGCNKGYIACFLEVFLYNDPEIELSNIADNLNKDYDKLKFYRDNDSHVTLGEDYVEKR